jgi:3-oxoacyl-[acyl-carrier protein] reductase
LAGFFNSNKSTNILFMNLLIQDQLFLVCGAGSGFGRAIAEALAGEGAKIIVVARGAENLKHLAESYPGQVEVVACDVTAPESIDLIIKIIAERQLYGMVVNAGGPPAMGALEASLHDWDNAYKTLLRWKVDIVQRLLPAMKEKGYGRIVFIESASVKQPIENLVLSNSLRLAVVGYAKTVSQEVGKSGITLNILAPSYHNSAAIDRIIKKKQESTGISREEAINGFTQQTSVGSLGNTTHFASLAIWLLSPHSRFINGQTISVDGGVVKGIMG